jgi:putative addiction module component (TIGR02574 family)
MTVIDELRTLPVAEKLQLVEDLWDSIAEAPGAIRLSAAHLDELDRRLDKLEASQVGGTRWDTLKERILASL